MSGHWTANIYYKDAIYFCNDSVIRDMKHCDSTNTVYIAIYARKYLQVLNGGDGRYAGGFGAPFCPRLQ